MNLVDISKIDDAVKRGKKINLICGTCGYVHHLDNSRDFGPDFLYCIPYDGLEKNLPQGRSADGKYLDYMGRSYDRDDFIMKFGTDPETYLKWKEAKKPRPNHTC